MDLDTIQEEAELEPLDPSLIKVMVHQAVTEDKVDKVSHRDSCSLSRDSHRNSHRDSDNCELYANRFTTTDSDVLITPVTRQDSESDHDDDILYETVFSQVEDAHGHSTVVANVVAKLKPVSKRQASAEKTDFKVNVHEAGHKSVSRTEYTDKIDQDKDIVPNSKESTEAVRLSQEVDVVRVDNSDMNVADTENPAVLLALNSGLGDDASPPEERELVENLPVDTPGEDGTADLPLNKSNCELVIRGCFGNLRPRKNSDPIRDIRSTSVLTAMDAHHKCFNQDLSTNQAMSQVSNKKNLHKKSATWEKMKKKSNFVSLSSMEIPLKPSGLGSGTERKPVGRQTSVDRTNIITLDTCEVLTPACEGCVTHL